MSAPTILATELRAAAARLRSTEHHGGITGDSDNPELLSLIVALLNAREPLAALLDDIAGEAERHAAHGMGNSQDEIITGPILDIARALNGASS